MIAQPGALRQAADALNGRRAAGALFAPRRMTQLAPWLFLTPWLIGLLAITRPDAGVALPVVHRLQPARSDELGRPGQLRARAQRRPQVLRGGPRQRELSRCVGKNATGV